MALLDRKSNFNCEIYDWWFAQNMHDFSNIILSYLKGNSEEGGGKIVSDATCKNTTGQDHVKKGGNL